MGWLFFMWYWCSHVVYNSWWVIFTDLISSLILILQVVLDFWTQFHENVLVGTVLIAPFFMDGQKGHIKCDLCFHYTLDQPLVRR